jgi:hypothetical protein
MIEVGRAAAADWFGRYHYTGTVGGCRFFLFDDLCMVAFGRGANRFGIADKFNLLAVPGGLEITRVACHPDAPRNTASRCVAAACKILATEGLQWVFSYSDTAQGHHGGIYQALGAIFVGTDAKQWVNFELDGKRVAKRMVSGRFGHTRWPEVAAIAASRGHDLKRVPWMPKLTYILPIGGPASRRKIRKLLADRALPYPKRSDDLAALATPYRNHRPK